MKNIIKSGFIVVAVAAIAGLATYSYFSDTATSTTNSFTSGTLSIDDGKVAITPAIVVPNMAPGDVTGEYSVIIENNGTMNLAWFGDWQFTGSSTLMDALYIADAKMEFLAPSGNTWLGDPASGYEGNYNTTKIDHFITNGSGSGPYPGWYNTLANLSGFHVITFNNWNNNGAMTPGTQYEHAGALRPGYKYKLTVKFGMASAAGNTFQGLGPVTAKLKVDATQINASQITTEIGWASPGMIWLNNQITDQTE